MEPYDVIDPQDFLDILDKAVKAAIGIKVKTSDPQRFIQKCYEHRKNMRAAGYNHYDNLTFRMTENHVWIVRNERKTNEEGDGQTV